MDVLKYWVPTIDWSRFTQGAVSDGMWRAFTDLVTLCHCEQHWREVRDALRLTRSPRPLHRESPHMRQKRLDEWKRPITDYENRMHRAAYLAVEKVVGMSQTLADQGTPDRNLYAAVAGSIDASHGQGRARYKSLALDAFDAKELSVYEPSVIAARWLSRAGYSEADEPQL
jgi:hypothetical protein